MRYPHLKRVFRGLLAAAIVLAAIRNAHAQNRFPLQEALKQINRVFGTNFVYDQDIVRGKTTSYDVKSAKGKPLEEVLKGVLYPDGLVFLYVKPNYYTIVTRERIQQQAAEKADTVAKTEK
ncbi:MAG TPA: STN domain-containing protein, partial [Dinghuibacter sp.]|uniref:STN domain-containing protein n=1 Tax=Dinghuibacter sp. TaxID=2024697 RepID=UPI002B7F143C